MINLNNKENVIDNLQDQLNNLKLSQFDSHKNLVFNILEKFNNLLSNTFQDKIENKKNILNKNYENLIQTQENLSQMNNNYSHDKKIFYKLWTNFKKKNAEKKVYNILKSYYEYKLLQRHGNLYVRKIINQNIKLKIINKWHKLTKTNKKNSLYNDYNNNFELKLNDLNKNNTTELKVLKELYEQKKKELIDETDKLKNLKEKLSNTRI